MPLLIEATDATGRLPVGGMESLSAYLVAAAAIVRVSGEIRVRVVGDAEMAALHFRFCGVEGTTDVVTFDYQETTGMTEACELAANGLVFVRNPIAVDTDIYVCLDVAERESSARGHGVGAELVLYAVHGLLHCLAFNDHDEDSHARMHALEDAILTQIGVGPLFASRLTRGADADGIHAPGSRIDGD